ncbi:MAG: hypothetical protein LBC02_10530 [Planctomycetaceae bacterium]|nr:hypothetical protein [Planctomycetaceae bacterium]
MPKTVSVEQNGPKEENDEKSTETTSVEKKGLEKETNSSTGKEEKETLKKSQLAKIGDKTRKNIGEHRKQRKDKDRKIRK